MNILVVDDESALRYIVRKHLQRLGHAVSEAENGLTAWEMFQRARPDMVITDWNMPEMNGADLIRHIREAGPNPYTYIIMVTARDERAELLRDSLTVPDDYLAKPLDADELIARVKIGERILRLENSLRANKQADNASLWPNA